MTAEEIAKLLDLQPHPEGGYFKEVYRSSGSIPEDALEDGFIGGRNYATSIYFLLTSDNFSAFHRIRQDEIWHFHQGSAIDIHVIDNHGRYSKNVVGNDIEKGQSPQFVVPAGCWFASSVQQEHTYSLVGCTVAPGFNFEDFQLAKREELINLYPQHEGVISTFTRN